VAALARRESRSGLRQDVRHPQQHDAAGAYSDAKGYLDDALALARRLQASEVVARLEARLAHIKAVFRSQFP